MDGTKGLSLFKDRHYPGKGDTSVGSKSFKIVKNKVKVLSDEITVNDMNFVTLSNQLGKVGGKFRSQSIQSQIIKVDEHVKIIDQ